MKCGRIIEMRSKKICHPTSIRKTKNGYEIKFKVDNTLFGYIQNAADAFTDGCACNLVSNCFLDRFEELGKKILEAREVPDKETPRH